MPAIDARAFNASVGELRVISSWWRDWAVSEGLSDEATDAGELCLNEAVANTVLYGCADGGIHEIAITFERLEGRVRITLTDDGVAFNPLEHPVPGPPATLEAATIGGRGIGLIRSFATEAQYRYENGRNILALTLTT